MSFWNTSDGGQVKAESEYEAPSGGSFDPIPHNTDVLGYIDEIKWGDKDGASPIEYRITVVKAEAFKNRKLFFKLWPLGDNPNKKEPDKRKKEADKSKRMLAAMDANAGSELIAINGKPSNEQLQSALMNKMMVFKIGMYDMPKDDGSGERNKGNYLLGVSPKTKQVSEVHAPTQASSQGGSSRVDDDEIPF